jgi:acylphosphatase
MADMIARRLRIHGQVQGVFYRNWTVQQAKALGVTGWVRNRSDGSVAIHAEGDAAALDKLTMLCRSGPPAARVERVDIKEAASEGAASFEKLPTG